MDFLLLVVITLLPILTEAGVDAPASRLLDDIRLRSVCMEPGFRETAHGFMKYGDERYSIAFERWNIGADYIRLAYGRQSTHPEDKSVKQYSSLIKSDASPSQYLYSESIDRRVRRVGLQMDTNLPETTFPVLFLNLCENLHPRNWMASSRQAGMVSLEKSFVSVLPAFSVIIHYNNAFLMEKLELRRDSNRWEIIFSSFQTYTDNRQRPLLITSMWTDTVSGCTGTTSITLEGWGKKNIGAESNIFVLASKPIQREMDPPVPKTVAKAPEVK